jgi:hypothetical protein
MIGLEVACVAIVSLYVVVRARVDARPGKFLSRLGLLMVASWVGENSVIHAYHFYAYAPRWSVFVDQVPLLVVTIWPVVIHSAWDLARRLTPRPGRVPFIAALLVLADASLIEPIAVKAGLWWWNEPGLFDVPPIGLLGWAVFAWSCLLFLEHRRLAILWTLVLAPVLVHLNLVALWWLALRWVNETIAAWPVVALAWALSLSLALWAHRRRPGEAIPRHELLLRIPAAGFFFVLLAVHAGDDLALIAYALAFAPPYLVLTMQARRNEARRD